METDGILNEISYSRGEPDKARARLTLTDEARRERLEEQIAAHHRAVLAMPEWECLGPCGELIRSEVPALQVCPACMTAWKATQEKAVEDRQPKPAVLEAAGVPEAYHEGFRLDRVHSDECDSRGWPTWQGRSAGGWMADKASGHPSCCLISGPNGFGKSMLAAELLWRLYHKGGHRRLVWTSTAKLARENKEHVLGRPFEQMSRAKSAGALVLDELGVGDLGQIGIDVALELVDHRWSNGLPTIYTTHRTKAQLAGGYSFAISSRAGSGLVVELTGRDQRQR